MLVEVCDEAMGCSHAVQEGTTLGMGVGQG